MKKKFDVRFKFSGSLTVEAESAEEAMRLFEEHWYAVPDLDQCLDDPEVTEVVDVDKTFR